MFKEKKSTSYKYIQFAVVRYEVSMPVAKNVLVFLSKSSVEYEIVFMEMIIWVSKKAYPSLMLPVGRGFVCDTLQQPISVGSFTTVIKLN